MEVSSEFPFSNNNWPSDITFSLNGVELGTWTSPGILQIFAASIHRIGIQTISISTGY